LYNEQARLSTVVDSLFTFQMKHLQNFWNWILHWLEKGDLLPLLVIVSAVHYVSVLREQDAWPVAIAIGLLVDVGHFRSVLIAVRYSGARRAELALRYGVACAMTAVSFSYHWRFYAGNLALALPMPLLIASLAYFERKAAPQHVTRAESPPQPACATPQGCGDEPYRVCTACDFTAYSPQAWAGHCRGKRHRGEK